MGRCLTHIGTEGNDFREVLKILKRAVDERRDELDTRKRIERYSKKMEKYYFDEGSK
jgi:hypothetical protein